MKKTLLVKLAMLLCFAMLLSLMFSCGTKKDEDNSATQANKETEAPVEETTATTETPTTTEPTTPAPTTTEAPTEPIDPSLPYYEQIEIEFSRFGFHDGDFVIAEDEQSVMKKFSTNGCKKTELDMTQEDVPFDYAYSIDITKEAANFWEISYNAAFSKDLTFTAGDIIAGVLWLRDGGGENPGQIYLAYKTATDDYNSEGVMNVNLVMAEDGWKKVYFYGEAVNDESKGSNLKFEIFLGYGIHKVEIGGIYIKRFSEDQFKAAANMPYNG